MNLENKIKNNFWNGKRKLIVGTLSSLILGCYTGNLAQLPELPTYKQNDIMTNYQETNNNNNCIDRYFEDNDGDGYGNPYVWICEQLPGHVKNNADYDDTDPSIYPNAPEICDNKDNDKNGIIDENLTRECSSICGKKGIETCINGGWKNCNALVPKTEEKICKGKDIYLKDKCDKESFLESCINNKYCSDGECKCQPFDNWCNNPECFYKCKTQVIDFGKIDTYTIDKKYFCLDWIKYGPGGTSGFLFDNGEWLTLKMDYDKNAQFLIIHAMGFSFKETEAVNILLNDLMINYTNYDVKSSEYAIRYVGPDVPGGIISVSEMIDITTKKENLSSDLDITISLGKPYGSNNICKNYCKQQDYYPYEEYDCVECNAENINNCKFELLQGGLSSCNYCNPNMEGDCHQCNKNDFACKCKN